MANVLTDIFTGDPAKEAAAQTRNYLSGVQDQGTTAIQGGLSRATGAVNTGATGGINALTTGYGDATTNADYGTNQALDYLKQGYGAASPYYDAARGAYAPLSDLGRKYGGATTLALNALGVNGQPGINTARGSFQAGPGYDFNLNQGIDAISRLRNAQTGGNAVGGNADRDAQRFGAGLASQEYDKWLNSLLGFTNPELGATSGAASGVAGIDTAQAGATNQLGQNQAALASDRGKMLADLASTYGQNVAGINTGQGNTLAQLETGAAGQTVDLSKAIAGPYAQTYGQEAAAQQQGSGNLWGLALNAGKLATGLYGASNGVPVKFG